MPRHNIIFMNIINSTQFGSITINNNKYSQVLIIGDEIKERDYKKLSELFGTSHETGDWEIDELIKNNPEIIIIGTGQDGVMSVSQKLAKKVREKEIELVAAPTPEAIVIYNDEIKAGSRVNALMHTTC